jgi:hypothetical protein
LDLNIVHVLLAEFWKSITRHIPEIISLLSNSMSGVRTEGADALAKLSKQGRVSTFLT